MQASDLHDHLEEAYETELSRLGSSKALYAVTEGDMEPESVLTALASRASAAGETFETWAADESNDAAKAAFAAAAETQRTHQRQLLDAGGGDGDGAPTELTEHLRGLSTTTERAAGLLAWAILTDRTLSQAVGFFVGSADRTLADLCRDLRADTTAHLDQALEVLDAVIDADPAGAQAAADQAVELAYARYVEVLEDMGIKVKPVC